MVTGSIFDGKFRLLYFKKQFFLNSFNMAFFLMKTLKYNKVTKISGWKQIYIIYSLRGKNSMTTNFNILNIN